jgi:hypothetical protein
LALPCLVGKSGRATVSSAAVSSSPCGTGTGGDRGGGVFGLLRLGAGGVIGWCGDLSRPGVCVCLCVCRNANHRMEVHQHGSAGSAHEREFWPLTFRVCAGTRRHPITVVCGNGKALGCCVDFCEGWGLCQSGATRQYWRPAACMPVPFWALRPIGIHEDVHHRWCKT